MNEQFPTGEDNSDRDFPAELTGLLDGVLVGVAGASDADGFMKRKINGKSGDSDVTVTEVTSPADGAKVLNVKVTSTTDPRRMVLRNYIFTPRTGELECVDYSPPLVEIEDPGQFADPDKSLSRADAVIETNAITAQADLRTENAMGLHATLPGDHRWEELMTTLQAFAPEVSDQR